MINNKQSIIRQSCACLVLLSALVLGSHDAEAGPKNVAKRLHLSPDEQARLHLSPDEQARLHLSPDEPARLHLSPDKPARLHLSPDKQARFHLSPDEPARRHLSPDKQARFHLSPDNSPEHSDSDDELEDKDGDSGRNLEAAQTSLADYLDNMKKSSGGPSALQLPISDTDAQDKDDSFEQLDLVLLGSRARGAELSGQGGGSGATLAGGSVAKRPIAAASSGGLVEPESGNIFETGAVFTAAGESAKSGFTSVENGKKDQDPALPLPVSSQTEPLNNSANPMENGAKDSKLDYSSSAFFASRVRGPESNLHGDIMSSSSFKFSGVMRIAGQPVATSTIAPPPPDAKLTAPSTAPITPVLNPAPVLSTVKLSAVLTPPSHLLSLTAGAESPMAQQPSAAGPLSSAPSDNTLAPSLPATPVVLPVVAPPVITSGIVPPLSSVEPSLPVASVATSTLEPPLPLADGLSTKAGAPLSPPHFPPIADRVFAEPYVANSSAADEKITNDISVSAMQTVVIMITGRGSDTLLPPSNAVASGEDETKNFKQGIWSGAFFANYTDTNGSKKKAGFAGGTIGYEISLDELDLLGVAFSSVYGKNKSASQEIRSDSYIISASAMKGFGNAFASGAIFAGVSNNNSIRTASNKQTQSAKFKSYLNGLTATIGYQWRMNQHIITPQLNLAYFANNQDGYKEKGCKAQEVESKHSSIVTSKFLVKYAYLMEVGAINATPSLTLGLSQDLGLRSKLSAGKVVSTGEALTVRSGARRQTLIFLTPSVDLRTNNLDVKISYTLERGKKFTGHVASVKAMLHF